MEKKRTIGWLKVFGLFLVLAGLFGLFIPNTRNIWIAGFLLTAGILSFAVYWTIYSRMLKGEVLGDERLDRINEKSGYQAFWATVGTAVIVRILHEISARNSFTILSEREGLSTIIITAFATFVICQYYLSRKGE
jgi:drug/metabolite transporter (DMT)-like permease